MSANYITPKLKEPIKRYQRLLHKYNNRQLEDAEVKELVKLSSLLVTELIKQTSKSKKLTMMDSDALRIALKNSV